LLFARASPFAVEKSPVARQAQIQSPAEKVVKFVLKNWFVERDLWPAPLFDQIGGLVELHIPIVVSMDDPKTKTRRFMDSGAC
jgi:hypothetical protein